MPRGAIGQKIGEVLCDSGGEFDLEPRLGEDLREVLDRAGRALDGACLTNVVVVQAGGKVLVGEFGFAFREVSEAEGRRIAEDLNFGEGR